MDRYDRQRFLDSTDTIAQDMLSTSKVLVIGLGGLGSPAAIYLASAGVGRIGLVDCDTVDISNLNRQILYIESDIGRSKATCARDYLHSTNSQVRYDVYDRRITKDNAIEIISEYDIVMSCVDSYRDRYIINEACVQLDKCLIDGAIDELTGYVLPIVPHVTPCYSCLMHGMVDSSSISQTIGAAAGIIGSMMAIEALKHICNIDSQLTSQMLVVDMGTMDISRVDIDRDMHCAVCGNK